MFDQQSPNPYEATAKTGIEPTFFGKVMMFFALAILSSTLGVYISFKYLSDLFFTTPALMYVLFVLELVIIFTAHWWKQKYPINRILFAAFTFISGVTISPLIAIVATAPGGVGMLSKALLITGLMFSATALIGWTTRYDLTGLRGFLMMGLIGMIVIGVISIFIPWSNGVELAVSGMGVLLFSGFTMYDFQKIKTLPQDAYIDAALILYLDIFNLFIYILRFIMAFSRRN